MDALGHILEPLPYHVEVRDFLKSREHELWRWFASAQAKADYTENLRLELLKSTYRLDAEGHPTLCEAVNEAKARLQLDIPVTLYQATGGAELNASLFFIPEEGTLSFPGRCSPCWVQTNSSPLSAMSWRIIICGEGRAVTSTSPTACCRRWPPTRAHPQATSKRRDGISSTGRSLRTEAPFVWPAT